MTAATEQDVAGTTPPERPSVPAAQLWRWHGRQLDPRRNSLNLIRLVLASTVLFAHGFYIAGAGIGPQVDGENLGGWAVFGFFAVSGYLITASRWANSFGTYLVHRVARIFPAFVVCLVVIAFVFAPIGYWRANGSLDGFLTAGPTTPGGFIYSNLFLRINTYEVAGTPADVAYPGAWDGSLWTLYYEFLSYLVVGLLGVLGWVRRSPVWVAVAWVLSVLGHQSWAQVAGPLSGGNIDLQLLLKLLPLFLGGALVQLLKERLPLHWLGAALCAATILLSIWALQGWGAQLTAPLIAYLLVWVGSVLPSPRLIQRHDISYGMYIYAFPVQQLLAMAGVPARGLLLFDLAALLGTVPFAVASWLLVERPIMRRARATHGGPPRTHVETVSPVDLDAPEPAVTVEPVDSAEPVVVGRQPA